ncbi:MAG TPA: S-methyl-5'-thioadenosine phosphorylase, partial [Nitrospinota bacterium]|nr:S-methyl-5'-thioadenosine phosphorylase [Nitrospinota bacterium]
AREAEICYATIALATDYDCWHEAEEDVTVEAILEILHKNVTTAQKIIKNAVSKIDTERKCSCKNALQNAILTAKNKIPKKTKKDLELIIGKYLK